MGVNKVILVGNVGKNPEIKDINDNLKVATFPLATTEKYTNKEGQKVTTTEWHNIVAWKGLATIAEKYIKKGSPLYIEGKINTESWEKDGKTNYRTKIVAKDIQMFGTKPKNQESTNTTNTSEKTPEPETDDLPF